MKLSSQKGLTLVEMLISASLLSLMVVTASVMYETAARSYFEMRGNANDFTDAMIAVEKVIKYSKMANKATVLTLTVSGATYNQLNLRLDMDNLWQAHNTPDLIDDDVWVAYTAMVGSGGVRETVTNWNPNVDPTEIAATDFSQPANLLARQDALRPQFSYSSATGRVSIDVAVDAGKDPYALFNQSDGQSYEKVHNTKTFTVSTVINAPVD